MAITTTDVQGNFSIAPGTYSCSAGDQVYLTASGGNPQVPTSPNYANAAIGLAAYAGTCATAQTATIDINEVSTVELAYSASATFDASTNTFILSGAPNTYDATKVNTIADILAACVNSVGPSSASCVSLTDWTEVCNISNNCIVPSTTLQAVVNMSLYPGQNVGNLFTLASAAAPFQPSLGSAPTDWSL